MQRLILLGLVVWAAAFAQQRGVGRGRASAPPRNPAAVIPPGNINPFHPFASTHAQRLGAAVSGYPGFMLGLRDVERDLRRRQPPFLVWGAGIPGWWGAPAQQPNITIVNNIPAQPPIIPNPNYERQPARPTIQEFAPPPIPESERFKSFQAPIPSHAEGVPLREGGAGAQKGPVIYLIALKDSSIRSAVAFWREDGDLHYMTPKHAHHKVSLSLVDTALTERLNRERGVHLPQPLR